MEIGGRELEASNRLRPLLTRAAGIALARLGEKSAAIRELTHSLESARSLGGEYDIAATIDALATLNGADPRLLGERDTILTRLRIVYLPTIQLGMPTL